MSTSVTERSYASGYLIRDALLMLAEDKWRPLVFLELARRGEMNFGQIRRSISGVRPKGLTKALRALEDSHLVDREVCFGSITRVAYRLTSRAHQAVPLLLQLSDCLLGDADDRSGRLHRA